jgi:hypothetical protein
MTSDALAGWHRKTLLSSIAIGLAAIGAGCGGSSGASTCQHQGAASMCFVSDHPHLYKLRASGLQPSASLELQSSVAPGVITLAADKRGQITSGSGIVTSGATQAVSVTLTGHDSRGTAISAQFSLQP